jgi:protein CpxP
MNVFSRTKSLLIIIAILLLSNISMLVYFLNRPHEQDRQQTKRPEMAEFFRKTVGFSSSQLADFEKRKQMHRDSIGRYFKGLNDSKEAFYRLLGQSPLDTGKYQLLADSIGQKQVVIEKAYFRHFQDVRRICTGDQTQVFDSLFPGELRKMIAGKRKK